MIPSRLPFPRSTVRAKILAVFLALSVFSLLITGYIALIAISGMAHSAESSSLAQGQQAVENATEALLQSEEKILLQTASDQAEITDILFTDTETELMILATEAGTLQTNPSQKPFVSSMDEFTPPSDPYQVTMYSLSPGITSSADSEEFRKITGMGDLLKGVYNADNDMTSVYIATDSGIMLTYPWQNGTKDTYDPRIRDWFTGAKTTPGISWTKPYVDADGHGLVITASKAVPTQYGYWVLGADITTDNINWSFLHTITGDNGYAILIDQDGNIISRPGLSPGNHTWDQPFPQENVFLSTDPALVALGRNMTAGKTGIERVFFGDRQSFVAYAPVRSQNWSLAISMPVDEVTAPVDKTRAGIIASTRNAESMIAGQSQQVMILFSLLFCIILVIVIILSITLSKAITRPIDTLKKAAIAIGHGDLGHRAAIQSGDEFEDLADSFNRMTSDLHRNIEELRRTTAEKERYAREMEIAKEIQNTFLPETAPHIPGYEICAVTIPAMEIGGDLYDFIPLEQGRWGFVIGDVSGKGVSAALYMALCRTQIHASGADHADPSEAIRQANRLIYDEGRSSMFITTFYAVLDPGRQLLSYVNAGHNPPLMVRANPPVAQMIEGKGIALGVIGEIEIGTNTLSLRPGDLILLYTDGITEAFNEHEDYYGEDRMMAVVTGNRSRPLPEIRDALLEDIRRFAGTAPQSDDITFILIRVSEERKTPG